MRHRSAAAIAQSGRLRAICRVGSAVRYLKRDAAKANRAEA